MSPDGHVNRIPAHRLGQIGNGHLLKLDRTGKPTAWDTDFERQFDKADTAFPSMISWLEGLQRTAKLGTSRERFLPQSVTDDQLLRLTECVVSLAIRSPKNRAAWVGFAEGVHGRPIDAHHRNVVIGANMMRSQRVVADSIGANAKFAVLFSADKEFLFGDGFFHNVGGTVDRPPYPRMLVPITPEISVIVVRPMEYLVEPKLSTLVLTADEVEQCNAAVQVYAAHALFFRSEVPVPIEAFQIGDHRQYANSDNPIDRLIEEVPGVLPRSQTFRPVRRASRG